MWFEKKSLCKGVYKENKSRRLSLKALHVSAFGEAVGGREPLPVSGERALAEVQLEKGSGGPSSAPSRGNRCFVSCLACRALMDEVEYDVTKARQKKTKVGSFRINPDGTQERRKVAEKKSCARV